MELKLRRTRTCSSTFLVIILCMILLIAIFGSTAVLGDQGENYKMEEDDSNYNAPEKPSLWGMTKNAVSLYTSSPWRVPTYLEKIKTLFNQVQAYFFPPSKEGRTDSSHEGGAGGKEKEAVGKSFGPSKSTVDDSEL